MEGESSRIVDDHRNKMHVVGMDPFELQPLVTDWHHWMGGFPQLTRECGLQSQSPRAWKQDINRDDILLLSKEGHNLSPIQVDTVIEGQLEVMTLDELHKMETMMKTFVSTKEEDLEFKQEVLSFSILEKSKNGTDKRKLREEGERILRAWYNNNFMRGILYISRVLFYDDSVELGKFDIVRPECRQILHKIGVCNNQKVSYMVMASKKKYMLSGAENEQLP